MRSRPCRRCGVTLLELLVALVVGMSVATVATAVLLREQRVARELDAAMTARGALRDGAAILDEALRGFTTRDTIAIVDDTAVELRTVFGASSVCAGVGAGATALLLAPDSVAAAGVLTGWSAPAEPDDVLLVLRDRATAPPDWDVASIADARRETGTACPDFPGLPVRVALQAPLASAVAAGTPIRFARTARYDVYRASDRRWYLGFRRCGASGCAGVQPAAGPFGRGALPPLRISAIARDGTPLGTGSLTGVARLEVRLRAPGSLAPRMAPAAADSVLVAIAARDVR